MDNKNSRLLAIGIAASTIPVAAAIYYFLSRNNNERKEIYYAVEDFESGTLDPSNNQCAPTSWTSLGLDQPLVIAMVGLPARGKSYIVKMLIRYLNWTTYEADVFNVGSYRRRIGLAGADANFFDMENKDSKKVREQMAMAVQDVMYQWLHEGSHHAKHRVAIFDATNTTKDRRLALANRARQENVSLLFVESICTDENVLMRNYELKLQNDDYRGMDPALARIDFLDRVRAYEKVYQTLEDDEDEGNVSYIKLVNVGQKIVARNCTGFLASHVAFYLQNIHIEPRRIFLSLLAENADVEIAQYNAKNLEDFSPTDEGRQFVTDLPKYLQYQQQVAMPSVGISGRGTEILILTGTSEAHRETVERCKVLFPVYDTLLLDELRGGDFHGMTRAQIKTEHPAEFEAREKNKLNYRYPGVGGESYIDVIERVKPVIIELERQRRSVAIVSHTAVLRCIFAYFMGTPIEKLPYLPFKHRRLYVLTPGAFGCNCEEIDITTEMMYL